MRIEAFYTTGHRKVTWEEIRNKRDELEQSPLEVPGFGTFDVDFVSTERMRLAIESFDDLPTLTLEKKLTWKLEDNTYIELEKDQLSVIYAEVKRLLGIRSAQLHVKAEVLKMKLPDVTAEMIEDADSWLA